MGAKKGHFVSEETRRKIGLANMGNKAHFGHKGSIESRKKMSESQRKNPLRYWKGKKRSQETKDKISNSKKGVTTRKGYNLSNEHKQKLSKAHTGKPRSEKVKQRLRELHSGEKCRFWKGGITPLIITIRSCFKYKIWRSKVFERDNWTCQTCRKRGCFLEAHHKKEFSKIIKDHNITTIEPALNCEELWDINNGVTLCEDCHNLTKKGNKL